MSFVEDDHPVELAYFLKFHRGEAFSGWSVWAHHVDGLTGPAAGEPQYELVNDGILFTVGPDREELLPYGSGGAWDLHAAWQQVIRHAAARWQPLRTKESAPA